MDDLLAELRREDEAPKGGEKICRGTLISRQQYLPDIEQWGYADARLAPDGNMSAEEIAHWTAAIEKRD